MAIGSGPSPRTASPGGDLCSLSPRARDARLAWIRAEILSAGGRVRELPHGVAWELASRPGLRERLEMLAERERACCGSLDFSVGEDAARGTIRFEVRGDGAGAFRRIAEEGFPSTASGPWPRRGALLARAAESGGIGLLASLLVCCAAPLAVAALLGSAAAAPLLALEDPWLVAGGALLGGAVAWRWLERRRERRSRRAVALSSCGCARKADGDVVAG